MAENEDGILNKMNPAGIIKTSTSELNKKSKQYANEKAKDDSRPTVDTSNVFGGEDTSMDGQRITFGTLNEIMDSTDTGTSIGEFLKSNWYWIFTIVFSVGVFLFSFRENLLKHGFVLWYTGVAMMVPVTLGSLLYFKKKVLADQNEYPIWSDVNSSMSYHFYTVKDSDDTMTIMPFVTDDENNVYRPDNPFDKRRPLTVRIDKDCLNRFNRGGVRGIITLGDIELDRTGEATFRIVLDSAYIPSPDMYQKNFELKMLKMQLEMEKKVSVSRREMVQKIAKADTGEWFKFVIGLVRDMMPVSKLMLRKQEGENVSNVRIIEALGEKGLISDDKKDEALEAIRKMDDLDV